MKNKAAAIPSVLVISSAASYAQLKRLLDESQEAGAYRFAHAAKLPEDTSAAPNILAIDFSLKNGADLCSKARAGAPLKNTPILALLPQDSPASIRMHALLSGADLLSEIPCLNAAEFFVKLEHLKSNARTGGVEERARLEWVLDASEDGFVLLDAASRVLYANPKARIYMEQASGSERLEGRNFLAVAKLQYRLEPDDAWQNWPEPAPNEAKRFLVRPETQSSRTFWLEATMLPGTTSAGSMLRLKNVTKQVTFFRNMQSFNVLVSHKMRTPVNQILLSAQLAENASAQELEKFHKLIIDGSKKMRDQVEEILAYISEDAVRKQCAPFGVHNLKALAEAIAETLNISNVAIDIDKKLQESHLAMSRASLELVFSELFRNAVKFHPSRSPEIQISVTKKDGYALVCISDDGQNLAPDQLEQAFTPYWQGEKFFTGQLEGMGLGLSLVQILMFEAGGRARFCNNPKRNGVKIELYIPLLQT